MFLVFEDRPSDSSLVERVWRSRSERAGVMRSIAACHWEMVVTRVDGRTSITVRGPETQATSCDCPAEGEWFGVRFKLGTFMPQLKPGDLLNRKDVTLPDASSRSFWLNGSAWEYPDFENAETFVDRLARRGLIVVDGAVAAALSGRPPERSTRTSQRRFLQTTGITLSAVRQIERVRYATRLLKRRLPIADVVYRAGYYDQAHLTRSLNRYVGRTPAQVLRSEEQLSFLYNTTADAPVMV